MPGTVAHIKFVRLLVILGVSSHKVWSKAAQLTQLEVGRPKPPFMGLHDKQTTK